MSNRVIFVVSDSVGETAELVVKAALSQFDGGSSDHSNIRRIPYVEDVGTIKKSFHWRKQITESSALLLLCQKCANS